jgi:hypothetical protein
MKKYIVYDGRVDKKEQIAYEYEVGEIIRVNSTTSMMCKKKEIVNGELNQYFVTGRLVFD